MLSDSNLIIDEGDLRKRTREWLTEKYRGRFLFEPIILHNLGLTISEFLKRKFSGEILSSIPRYNEMNVKPDIFSIVRLERGKLGLVIAECKINVGLKDFRQVMDYARTCQCYEAYLAFYGKLSEDVINRIRIKDILYNGLNRYGEIVSKELVIVEYRGDNTFIIKRKF
jgi:hypothetical protein